jgi:hypothetical protein
MLPSEYLTILQLSGEAEPDRLERAYRASVARYERLTRRGPLQFYRRELLADAQRAFESIRRGENTNPDPPRPSLLRRRAEQTGLPGPDTRQPIVSSQKMGQILAGQPEKIHSRSVKGQREIPAPADPIVSERDKVLTEDRFCREVIYRLEGDLIRYSSRCDLLRIAQAWQIPQFHANMLIAQIVEAVRHNKLYEISGREKQFWSPTCPTPHSRRGVFILAGLLLAAALAAEAWLLRRWFE